MIEIDGQNGEGGGSLLRQALSLSLYTGKSFRIKNIRKNRPKPGLNAQHLKSIELAIKVSGSKATGMFIGSEEVEFIPQKITASKNITLDIGTAGSITLLLQSVLLPCLLSGQRFKFGITGGTDVFWSPPIDYSDKILFPILRNISPIELRLIKRGYYPKGKGSIELKIGGTGTIGKPDFQMINSTNLQSIQGLCHASKLLEGEEIVEKTIKTCMVLLSKYKVPINIHASYTDTESIGAGLLLYGVLEASTPNKTSYYKVSGDALWNPKEGVEKLAENACNLLEIAVDMDVPVDKFTTDQLIPYLGIFGGSIKTTEITEHTKSNIYLTELFLEKKFSVNGTVIKC